MIANLLPAGVACVERTTDVDETTLYPAEARLVQRAVDKRRREFATVRDCARRALRELGLAPAPILPGPRGAPQWPATVVGSMTHCVGYRAAAVAPRELLAAVGIDAEPHEPLPEGVDRLVLRPEERDRLAGLARHDPRRCWDRLVFSVKESVYKAWFPLTGQWLDFAEASVTLEPTGRFTTELLVPGPVVAGTRLTGFAGRWSVADGLLLTAVVVPATGAAGTDRPTGPGAVRNPEVSGPPPAG